MIKSQVSLLIAFFSVFNLAQAQEAQHLSYNWDENPEYTIAADDSSLDVVALKDYSTIEFAFENEDEFYQYTIIHKVLWLNADDRIEQFNKIYLPYSTTSELLRSQARVISPSGVVRDLDESKIFTATDETTNSTTKYYALEGIEKGGFIEYLYVIKKSPDFKGSYLRVQKDYKIVDARVSLFSPENLIFKMYPVNSDQEAVTGPKVLGKQHLIFQRSNLDKLEEEDLSAPVAMREAVIYKLVENTATGGTGFGSYKGVSKNVFGYVFKDLDKKVRALLSGFLSEAKINKTAAKESQIRQLENYIKNTIYITETGGEQLADLGFVLENKAANETGVLRLFANALQELEIPFELVLTCDRFEKKFDKEIEALTFLQSYLLYFPKSGKYLSPGKQESRYGYPPTELTDTYGLFIQKVSLGDLNSGVGRVKYIESPEATASLDEMNYKVRFDPEDLTEVYIDYDRAIGGYNAAFIHPFTNRISSEDKEDFYKRFIKSMGNDVTITSKEILNELPENFGVNPLRIKAQLTSTSFMDKAGPKYLFKLGALIGEQIEMYQEKARQLPVENLYRKKYLRTIEVTIPDGYTIKNLEDIIISNRFDDGDQESMYFESSYEQEGNKLIITANELYEDNILPVEQYEAYRTVINSAADFNKVTLILEPIK